MVLNWVDRFLRIDELEQTEQREQARILGVVLLILLSVLGIITLVHLLLSDPTALDTSIGMVAVLGALLLVRQGYLELARWLIPGLMFALVTYITVTNLGVTDEAVFAYPTLIALSGLLLARRGVIVATLLSLLSFISIGMVQAEGLLPGAAAGDVTTNRLVVVPALLALVGLVMLLVIGNLLRNLGTLSAKERALAASNLELQAIRENLEAEVQERTRSAEQARNQAEEATRAMQTQVWLAVGQAELNERMRGEQSLQTLANNVIRTVCNYLDAQVGALYVQEKDVYKLAAGYAYDPGTRSRQFSAGEGVVGQAALEKQIITLTDLPPNSLVISSGLGRTVPNSVVVVPFLYNEDVEGVLEIGKLTPFLPEEQKFLAIAASSIGIAFHTVHSRTRMTELLAQLQEQFML